MINIFPILFTFVIIITLATIIHRHENKDYGKKFQEFFKKENEANMVRKKEIPEDLFFTPNLSELPFTKEDNSNVSQKNLSKQKEVLKCSEKKMIRFLNPITNTELKMKFGYSNLEFITSYEENFFSYIYAINSWAETLVEDGNEKDAQTVLYHGVMAGAETSKTYIMLADIYYKNNKRAEMAELYDVISNKKMPAQDKAWRHVNDYYIKMGLD